MAGMWKHRHVTINESLFKTNKLSPQLAWLLGLFAADGNVSSPDKYGMQSVSIPQSGAEGRKIIQFVKDYIGHNGALYTIKTSGEDSHSIYFRSDVFIAWLETYGVRSRKTHNLEFPINLSEDEFPHFLRGYTDGDGCLGIYPTGTTDVFLFSVAGRKSFLNGIQSRVPVKARMYQLTSVQDPLWELRWYGENGLKVGKLVYDTGIALPGYKELIYRRFTANYTPKYMKYTPMREKALTMMDEGCYSAQEIADCVGTKFQTVYKWREIWRPRAIFRGGKPLMSLSHKN